MIDKVKSLVANQSVFGTIIVTGATVFGAGFSYLLQFILARKLTLEDYGSFNAFLALAYIINVPAGVLTLSLIKMVSEFKAESSWHKVFLSFRTISLIAFAIGGMFVFVFTFFKVEISNYLHITDVDIPFNFALSAAFTLVMFIPAAYLQGLLRFKSYSFYVITYSFLRFAFSIGALALGFKVAGVYGAIAVAFALSYLIGVLLLTKNFQKDTKVSLNEHYKKVLLFSGSVFFVNLGMILLNTVDVILVKRFFLGETAGIYSSVVTIGKILLFGAGAVTIVMFPQISELYAKRENYVPKLIKFIKLQLLAVVVFGAFFVLAPQLLVTGLFGSKFGEAVPYVAGFTVFMSIYVLINFLTFFFLAIEKTKIFIIQLPLILVQFGVLNVIHRTLYEVINVNIMVSLAMLMILLIYLRKVISMKSR